MKAALVLAALAGVTLCSTAAVAAPGPSDFGAPKVVMVTFDGVRWQDIFRGADPVLMNDPRTVNPDVKSDVIGPAYLDPPDHDRAAALTPFLHGVVAKEGVLIGDRDHGDCASVANDLWYSYPGYNEFLTGAPDPSLTDNGKTPNPNVSVLEYLQNRPGWRDKAAMVGTWDVFPYIVNGARTDVPVNQGMIGFPTDVKTARLGWKLLHGDDRRFIYIAFGDTDEFAHAGDYAAYAMSIERGDEFLREVWDDLQSDPYYRGKTTLLVLTDHGRGESENGFWREHGSKRAFDIDPDAEAKFKPAGAPGSGNVWMAAIGPAVRPALAQPYRSGDCAHSAQIARSILVALGLPGDDFRPSPKVAAYAPLAFIASPEALPK